MSVTCFVDDLVKSGRLFKPCLYLARLLGETPSDRVRQLPHSVVCLTIGSVILAQHQRLTDRQTNRRVSRLSRSLPTDGPTEHNGTRQVPT